MKSLLVKNIRALVSCDGEDRVYQNVNLYAEDGLIRSIGPEAPEADQVIDASGMYCYPGLINTHHHFFQNFSRNLPQAQNQELFDWLHTMFEIWKRVNPDVIRYSALSSMGELMKNGCTTIFDHHYLFHKNTGPDPLEAQAAAAKELGARMYLSRGGLDRGQKDGGLPPNEVVQTTDEILRSSVDVVQKYHDPSFQSMCRLALAPCSPFTATADLYRESAKLAREYKVRIHTHLCETKDEEDYTLEKVGLRPVAYMQELGMTGSDVWYAHGIHFNDDELKILAETQSGVCHCPISNMKLSSGVCRVPEMLEMGIPVGLGVDGSASNDGSNLLEELRVAYLLHRLNSSDKAPSGYDMLKIATVGGAKVLGWTDAIGSLEVGKCADFFLVDGRRMELIGAMYDPKSVFGTVGLKGPVDYTVVNGRVTVDHGRLVTVDEEKLSAESAQVISKYLEM